MPFPVTVKFKRKLKAIIIAENIGDTLSYVQKEIESKKADKVTCDESSVNYKGSTSNLRGSLFGGMNGTFTIINDDIQSHLVYEIRMYQLFITTSIMAVAAGILTRIVWVGVGAFAWLCGMNWLVSLARHGSLASELAAGIDQIHGIPIVDLDDKNEHIRNEKLKNWM